MRQQLLDTAKDDHWGGTTLTKSTTINPHTEMGGVCRVPKKGGKKNPSEADWGDDICGFCFNKGDHKHLGTTKGPRLT